MSLRASKVAVGMCATALLACLAQGLHRQTHAAAPADQTETTTFAHLEATIQTKSDQLAATPGMRNSFAWFTSERGIAPQSIHYSDYVKVRMIFEATRDAGFWNMHWTITNEPPNSDHIWQQWKDDERPSFTAPTASAECDELSALFSFLTAREGVKDVGLFWPYPNHTVAVWSLHPTGRSTIRVVVPTSQIFLTDWDDFDTRKFDPWTQKTVYDYTRRDVPDSFSLPTPLFHFFVEQIDKYAGASDYALLQIRYLREGVFLGRWTPEAAAQEAVKRADSLSPVNKDDISAFKSFASDMRTGPAR
jgi:hypothetical protein